MRASSRWRFCYVAAPQCASTSLRDMLAPFADIFSNTAYGGVTLPDHAPPRTIRAALARMGHDPAGWFFFSSVRNPWDRMVSRYHYGLRNPKSIWHPPAAGAADFAAFVRHPDVGYHSRRFALEPFLFERGTPAVDDVVRVESFAWDLRRIQARLGLGDLPLLKANETPREAGYRDWYDPATRDLVAEIHASDIAWLGYRF